MTNEYSRFCITCLCGAFGDDLSGDFSSTGSEVSAVVGCVVAIVLAYMKRGIAYCGCRSRGGRFFLVQMIGF